MPNYPEKLTLTCGLIALTLDNMRGDSQQFGRVHYDLTVTAYGQPVAPLTRCPYSPAPAQYTPAQLAHCAISDAIAYAGYDSAADYHTDPEAGEKIRNALEFAPSSPKNAENDEQEIYKVTLDGKTTLARSVHYKPLTKTVKIIQGNYGQGWEDLAEYALNDKSIKNDLAEYRKSAPNYPHRIISRRIPNQ